jgi:Tfp pilus assembly protein PilE
MKKLLIAVVIIAVLVIAGKISYDKIVTFVRTDGMRERVNSMLVSLKAEQEQEALSQWAKGQLVMTGDEMQHYTTKFDDFRQKKGIFNEVSSFEIKNVTLVSEYDGYYALVDCEINGKDLSMNVRKDEPIQWAD